MKRFILLAFALSLVMVKAQDTTREPQITITGSAEVRVAPDEVLIHAGVETRNENLDQARHEHDERMKNVLTFLKNSGIPGKDVQTDFINLVPDYGNEWGRGPSKTPVFVARKFIEVRLTNITNLETILTGMLNTGVDRINNVEFRTTQLRKFRDQARAMAVRAAREKADALCAELGVKRGKPLNINASESGGIWNYYGYMGQGANVFNNVQTVAQSSDNPPDSAGETLSLGQVSVSATVTVSFAIE